MRSATILLLLLGACGDTIDTTGLAPLDGYRDWTAFELTGEVPGHGSGRRVVYVNDVGRMYTHAGRYRPGTVIVKDIFESEDGTGEPDYISVMRKIAGDDPAAEGLPLDGGWLFTLIEDGDEVYYDFCWARCHQAASYDGAWYDYGAP